MARPRTTLPDLLLFILRNSMDMPESIVAAFRLTTTEKTVPTLPYTGASYPVPEESLAPAAVPQYVRFNLCRVRLIPAIANQARRDFPSWPGRSFKEIPHER